MEHYITDIFVKKLHHLSDLHISLDPDNRQHLLLTGKNGSCKTSLLLAIQTFLSALHDQCLELLFPPAVAPKYYDNLYKKGIDIQFNTSSNLDALYETGDFIIAAFPADRKTQIHSADGVINVKLDQQYPLSSDPGQLLLQYMVHLKTQQSYATNEGDTHTVEQVRKWFDRFESALRILLDDDTLSLKYDFKSYDFKLYKNGREPFGFHQLSDGYSSVLHIVSNLILRMDRNWLLNDRLSEYDLEGIVLIDELETHLHIELQKKILPFLTAFFPRLQFIITTHSPYILNSVANAKAYDLEKCIELENLAMYSSEELAEGYFDSDAYSDLLKSILNRYEYLTGLTRPDELERAERARLRCELKNLSPNMARDARNKFEEIEATRNSNDQNTATNH